MNGSAETAPRLSFPTAFGGGTMLTFSSDSAAEDESTNDIPATPFTRLVAPPPFAAAAAEDAVVVVVTLYEYSDDLLLLVVLAWLIRCDDGDKGPFDDDCGCFDDDTVSKRLAFIVVVVELLLLLTPFTAFCS